MPDSPARLSIPASTPIAEFARSPLVEVALAVAFQPIPGLRTIELGRLYHERFGARFPKVSEQPRVEMPTEQFGTPTGAPGFSFQLLDTPLVPRLWFMNEDETDLVQVQNNWFARNWRQLESGAIYPHYPQIRAPFEGDLNSLLTFVQAHELGLFRPSQCEITYTNHIEVTASGPRDLHGVLTVFSEASAAGPLGHPETVKAALQWMMRDGEVPIGRVHISAEPAIRRSDQASVLVLTVTARGRPLGDGVEGVLSFLDRAHENAVEMFVAVTTDEMHRIWGMTT